MTPTVGGLFFSSSDQLESAPLYGLKIAYDMIGNSFGDTLGVEGSFNHLSTKSKVDSGGVDGYLLRADAVYSINPRSKWVPFLAVGLGGIFLDKNGSSDNNPLINYGLGLKYFLEDYLALRVDARHLLVYKDVDTRNNLELSVGLTYVFGKERKKPVRPALQPVQEKKAAPVVLSEATLLEYLGATSPAVLGITLTPIIFPAQPVTLPPAGTALAFKGARPPAPAPAPVPAPAPLPEVAPEPATAPAPLTTLAPEPAPAPAPAPFPVLALSEAEERGGVENPPLESLEDALEAALPTVEELALEQSLAFARAAAQGRPRPAARTATKAVTVEFDFNSFSIKPDDLARLRTVADFIRKSSKASVRIEGHTDNIGKMRPNLRLSLRRAETVKQHLVRLGVDRRIVSTKGYHFSRPIASNDTEAGRQRNRRAVAVIVVVVEP